MENFFLGGVLCLMALEVDRLGRLKLTSFLSAGQKVLFLVYLHVVFKLFATGHNAALWTLGWKAGLGLWMTL